jgi:hypothetical protein
MSREPLKTPDILIEQLRLGEISADDERALRAQLPAEELERKLLALRTSDEEFAAEHDANEMVTAIKGRLRTAHARAQQTRTPSGAWRVLVPGLAVAALALVFLAKPGPDNGKEPSLPTSGEYIGLKGQHPHLVLHRRQEHDVETLLDGAHARPGDMLQVGYVAAGATHGVIVSLDGGGTVSLHFPESEAQPTILSDKGEQLLAHAYELDAAPRFERFFFITDSQPIDVKKVLAAAHSLARAPSARTAQLALPASMQQQALTLVKE